MNSELEITHKHMLYLNYFERNVIFFYFKLENENNLTPVSGKNNNLVKLSALSGWMLKFNLQTTLIIIKSFVGLKIENVFFQCKWKIIKHTSYLIYYWSTTNY